MGIRPLLLKYAARPREESATYSIRFPGWDALPDNWPAFPVLPTLNKSSLTEQLNFALVQLISKVRISLPHVIGKKLRDNRLLRGLQQENLV